MERIGLMLLAALMALTITGCGDTTGDDGKDATTVVVATHDSWAVPEELIARFEEETGLTVKVRPQGDAGTLTNTLVLTQGTPLADVVFGIDNTFASRAVEEGVLTEHAPASPPASAAAFALDGDGARYLTPIDYGDVCINIDDAWFAEAGIDPPTRLADLTDPTYRDLTVVPGAATSSPGLAFLLATIGADPDGWQDYWRDLVANGVKVVSGWSDAYLVDFTAGEGRGDRPITVSYSSSPPATLADDGSGPTTSALLDTCFRQVEYAGVLKGAKNPDGAAKFIEFLQGKDFQAALPQSMYVYPVDSEVALPADWEEWAPTAEHPIEVPSARIGENRTEWIRTWREIATG